MYMNLSHFKSPQIKAKKLQYFKDIIMYIIHDFSMCQVRMSIFIYQSVFNEDLHIDLSLNQVYSLFHLLYIPAQITPKVNDWI